MSNEFENFLTRAEDVAPPIGEPAPQGDAQPSHRSRDKSLQSCNTAQLGRRFFVPWSESGQGRLLCWGCLMTLWRMDTQREFEQRRLAR